jgi:predicted dehydrogenase
MKVAILGSGFGLYGYLPALIGQGCDVLLPERYRAVVEGRGELASLSAAIEWVADDAAALDRAEALVLARRPEDQAAAMADILGRPNIQRLLLEKPLAPTPAEAERLQTQLQASGKLFRIGYIFGFTEWGQRLIARAASSPRGDLAICWAFRAHHYATDRQNWKRSHAQGGGALRFYGIQLLALAAQLGFTRALHSTISSRLPDEAESWSATMANEAGDQCALLVDSNAAEPHFSVTTPWLGDSIGQIDPFNGAASSGQDRRVPLLSSLCAEMLTGEPPALRCHAETIALWRDIEAITTRQHKA